MKFKVIHVVKLSGTALQLLEALVANTNHIIEQNNLIINKINSMAEDIKSQFDQVLQQIEAATTQYGTGLTAVADRISGLEQLVSTLGLPADAEKAILDRLNGVAPLLQSQAEALTALGKTPETPVPTTPIPELPPLAEENPSPGTSTTETFPS